MSLLVVGTIAFDTVATPHGRRDEVLGGSASYVATAASFFCPVRMVGVVGDDFPERVLTGFQSRGIDTAGVSRKPGKTFRWHGNYERDLNAAVTVETQLNVLKSFDPTLPQHFRDSEVVCLGNFDPELQGVVLDQVTNPAIVACDTMNFWIEGHRSSLTRTLQRVSLLCINEGEARLLAGEANLLKAATAILRMGPKHLIVKRGEHGAMLFSPGEVFAAPAFPLESVKDPTGAGDSFAGGLLGYLARAGSEEARWRQGVVMGSVMASFACEDFSLDRLVTLTHGHIADRFARFTKLTHYDAVLAPGLWG